MTYIVLVIAWHPMLLHQLKTHDLQCLRDLHAAARLAPASKNVFAFWPPPQGPGLTVVADGAFTNNFFIL